MRSFAGIENQAGAIFAVGERISGLNFFDSTETFRKLFPKLLRSYGLDALDQARRAGSEAKVQFTPEKAHAFLARAGRAKAKKFPAVEERIDVRLIG